MFVYFLIGFLQSKQCTSPCQQKRAGKGREKSNKLPTSLHAYIFVSEAQQCSIHFQYVNGTQYLILHTRSLGSGTLAT